MSLAGHFWTLSTRLRRRTLPPADPSWSTLVEDSRVGPVRLSGQLDVPVGARDLVVLVHGLGGCSESGYMSLQSRVILAKGLACLRLNLRGADRRGEDFYHAGLVEDLEAALASPQLASFRRIYLWGNSLGGHTVIRWALEPSEPRVKAVAAICSPLDLEASSRSFASVSRWPYRRYVLRALNQIYAAVAARREVPLPPARAARIRTLHEWDERIVAPRHGFSGAEDYYRRMSVASRLPVLDLPCLYVGSLGDPMVPVPTVRPVLASAPKHLEVRWAPRGGHMAFPRHLDLGFPGKRGAEEQVLAWLLSR